MNGHPPLWCMSVPAPKQQILNFKHFKFKCKGKRHKYLSVTSLLHSSTSCKVKTPWISQGLTLIVQPNNEILFRPDANFYKQILIKIVKKYSKINKSKFYPNPYG